MVQRRRILAAVTRARLVELAREFEIPGLTRRPKEEIVRAISAKRSVKTHDLLESLKREELKAACRAVKLDDGGRQKAALIARLMGEEDGQLKSAAKRAGNTTKIAMWMLDPDYDGRGLCPQQVFSPMAGPKDGSARLAKNLKAEIDEELIEAYRGTVSLPFDPGDHRRVAVRIVDDWGIESLKIVDIN